MLEELQIDGRVAELLRADGIEALYPPQEEAWKALRDGQNVVAAIPTASGKSLIAYLALLHDWLRTGKKGLYIVPLRALASEKFEELRAFRSLGLKVGIATGDLDENDPRVGRNDIIVCTSEKADSLLRHRVGWVTDIGCIVSDEIHLLHDAGRGPTLEVLLSRFRALYPDTRIVGLSATIDNADAVAAWLDADLVTSNWRPVELKPGTYHGDSLELVGDKPRVVPSGRDPVASLVEDTIRDGGQCLVFVSTRRSAEAQAVKLGGVVRDLLDDDETAALAKAADDLGDDGEGSPTQKKVRKLAKAGVAYHTAGLDAKQRRFVEENFRARRIKVICATPTLAAGVNTPARRVIIRDLTRFEVGYGSRPLPVMEVHQMMGRAGRPRYDPVGEAVLVCKSEDMRDAVVAEYLHGRPEAISSKLAADASLRIHVLASVAGGYCDSEEALLTFLKGTFWAQEAEDWLLRDRLDDVLWYLEDHDFLERDGPRLEATRFGRRTSDLYIDPMSALRLRQAFDHADEPSPFGLLEVVAGCPDIYPLYLRKADEWVEARLLERGPELLVQKDLQDWESALSFVKTACLLSDWCEEVTHQVLEDRYSVGPGDIRMRVDTAKWLVHAFGQLARVFRKEWVKPLDELGVRLTHGIRTELLPLVRIRGVGRVRARTLHAAGFKTPKAIAKAPLQTIAGLAGFGDQSARALFTEVGAAPQAAGGQPQEQGEGPADATADPEGQSSLAAFKDA